MTRQADWIEARRQEAWSFGRALRESLLAEYRALYRLGEAETPPPAVIVDELIRDILDFKLHFDPLPANIFAQTCWQGGETIITVNSLTSEITGVKDHGGVQNVAKWHEAIHGYRDAPASQTLQPGFAGFDLPAQVVCYRSGNRANPGSNEREFWAEEAGRAAAVSYRHLFRSEAFRSLTATAGTIPNAEAWSHLYQSAADIGVNISALVTQLKLEGLISVDRQGSRQILQVQPALQELNP